MAVPILPDSAPFSPSQRAWLNGFFAGLLGLSGDENVAVAGNDGASAQALAAPAEEEFPWHDAALPMDERLKLAEGKPLKRRLMAAMAQLDCGACGYVCQTYSEAIARGEERDFSRCSPGGKETMVQLKSLMATAGSAQAANGTATNGASHGGNGRGHVNGHAPGTSRNKPLAARLVESRPLNDPASEKDTRLVIIDLVNSGLAYTPGDSLGVLPHNSSELVSEILSALGANGAQIVESTRHGSHALQTLLSRKCALTKVAAELLELLVRSARASHEAERLRSLCADDADDPLLKGDLLDLLTEFPSARPVLAELVDSLPELQPRLYSIASSLRAHPNQVHLTVGVVRYEHHGRQRHGVASNFLGPWASAGQEIEVFVHGSKFRLPADPARAVIMVGPGTGIAPFRAFLQDRAATGATGPNWLFFGNPRRNGDFLYQDELKEFSRRGILTRLDTAFSRDQAEKHYVQHRMLEQAAELWKWLEGGAHFYVCGDARRMARDVDQALVQIAEKQGRMTPEQAKAWVGQLTKGGRYQRDVY